MSENETLPTLCLAASGGGHVRQILDLVPLWHKMPHYFVTEQTALGESIASTERTFFVPHVALGQARLGAPFSMLWSAIRNAVASASIVARTRPDIVLTTGAGSMFFIILWARMLGAHIILIDSFARFDRPSAFARIAGKLAHLRIAQSERSGKNWPGSIVFDPFLLLDDLRPKKDALLFATVGATLPFDRLVRLVSEAKRKGLLPDEVVVQTGIGGAQPENLDCIESLPFDDVQRLLKRADYVVCHGGTGSLITALQNGCRTVAVPRRFALGEHYDDHQSEITRAFHKRGLIEVADTVEEFEIALRKLQGRTPAMATTEPTALLTYLEHYIDGLPK